MKIAHAQESHVGMRRKVNQDALGAFESKAGELFVVCDGMGGHAGGEVASSTAVEAIGQHFRSARADADPADVLRETVLAGNAAILAEAERRTELRGMGSTIVALLIPPGGEQAFLAHVGDSRIYLLRGDSFEQLTKDHTTVQRYVDQGTITKEQAVLHPHAGIISRTLGVDPDVEVELGAASVALEESDIFVLCTDGLTGMLDDLDIMRFMVEYPLGDVCRQLIALANARGGYDNVTVQAVQVGRPRIVHGPSLSGMARISDLLREQVQEADAEMARETKRPLQLALLLTTLVLTLVGAVLFLALR